MDPWQLIVTPDLPGEKNMRVDLKLFQQLEKGDGQSTLRFYSWQPQCISLGYSQIIDEEIDLLKARELGWDVVKRPTGGGIVFHNRAEVTYSLVTAIDNPLLPKEMIPSYKKISEAIVSGLKHLGINAQVKSSPVPSPQSLSPLCFSFPAEYEIVVGGRKLVGSAQKRGKRALLQQGSIFVRNTDSAAFSLLKKPVNEYNAVSLEEILGREISFEEVRAALINGFKEYLGIKFNED